MMQAPREVIATMSIDGLEEPEENPNVHREKMDILRQGTPDERAVDRSESEDRYFNRRSVFRRQAKRRRVLVMNLVDVLVEGTPM